MSDSATIDSRPWWQFGHVWLVVSGPLTVVIASFFTFYLAAVGTDPLVDENYYQKGVEINRTLSDAPQSLAPAMQARNHAATGVVDPVMVPKAP